MCSKVLESNSSARPNNGNASLKDCNSQSVLGLPGLLYSIRGMKSHVYLISSHISYLYPKHIIAHEQVASKKMRILMVYQPPLTVKSPLKQNQPSLCVNLAVVGRASPCKNYGYIYKVQAPNDNSVLKHHQL